MSDVTYRFLEPLDVLFLRGNKLFGDSGSFGESLVPPWPSVAAGALRSRMLVVAGIDLADFARGAATHPQIGTPATPGPFTITAFHLARRMRNGAIEILVSPPADVVVSKSEGGLEIRRLERKFLGDRLPNSYPLPELPVLAEPHRSKPESGYWLAQAGWQAYLRGEVPQPDQFVAQKTLWAMDTRVGVGLDKNTRAAEEGRLFTVQAVAPVKQVTGAEYDLGFVVGIAGADPPQDGLVRLGGDGRAASLQAIDWKSPEPDYDAIARKRRCRLVLTTPGIFEQGWLPTGAARNEAGSKEGVRFELSGVRGRIVAAAVPRAETVSGWDLAKWQPKPAQRVAPTGSVYWLELDEGVSAEDLRKLVARGLWPENGENAARRAEGFNRFVFAA